MNAPQSDRKKRLRRPCPRCHCGLRRTRRGLADQVRAWLMPTTHDRMGRYRCLAAGCGWEGLIERQRRSSAATVLASEVSASTAWTTRRQVLHGLLAAVSLAGLALAAAATLRLVSPPGEMVRVGPRQVERGHSHDGDALPPDHPLMLASSPLAETDEIEPPPAAAEAPRLAPPTGADGLTLRRHCAWGQPGRNPYQGSVETALRTARLSEAMVQRIAADVKARKPVDRISISNGSIRADASGRRFDPRQVAMTYGKTLCVETRINFAKGHVERADLYEASDAKGNVVAVMVPDVCGNVSVLSEVAEEEDLKASDLARQEGRSSALRRLPAPLVYKDGFGGGSRQSLTVRHLVSTPTTLACSLLGLAVMAWFRRRRAG